LGEVQGNAHRSAGAIWGGGRNLGHGDARLERLATECRETLRRIESKMAATPGPHVGVDLGDVR
jgi:hypothetical protein